MKFVLIVFSSLTTANKIKSELEKRYSIKSKVIQTPKNIPVKSCSYCVKVLESDMSKAWNMVKSLDVYTKGVFGEKDFKKII